VQTFKRGNNEKCNRQIRAAINRCSVLHRVLGVFVRAKPRSHRSLLQSFFFIGVGLVLLPSILAAYSDHPKFVWVMLVNIFFSWTVIFWIVSLMWALKGWGNRRNAKGIADAAKAS